MKGTKWQITPNGLEKNLFLLWEGGQKVRMTHACLFISSNISLQFWKGARELEHKVLAWIQAQYDS